MAGSSDEAGRYAADGVFIGQGYLYSGTASGVGYTPIGQKYLMARMCTDVFGFSCPQVVDFLTEREPTTGEQWVVLLGPRAVVAHADFAGALREELDWPVTAQRGDFTVIGNPSGPGVGRMVHLGDGTASAVSTSDRRQVYAVGAGSDDRVAVFSDVYWPGYRATWNGQPLAVTALENLLVQVTLPPGEGELVVEYVPAGSSTATACVVLGLLLTALLASAAVRRPHGSPGAVEGADSMASMSPGRIT
jgi:hypothetical protein